MKLTRITIAAMALALSGAAIAAGSGGDRADRTTATSRMTTQPTKPTQTTTARQTMTARSTQSTTTRSPAHATGQPGAECGSATAPNTPGHSSTAPGSAFNPDGVAGSKYAGEQPQNSRNTASVSQYDAACLHQNH